MAETSLLPAFIDVYFSTIKNTDARISRPMAKYRLSFEQYEILYDVAHLPAVSLTDIVKKRGVTKPAIARQLKVLRDLGYLTQKLAPDDHRRHILTLTPMGKRVAAEAEVAVEEEFARWVEVMGEAKLNELLGLLKETGTKLFNKDTAAENAAAGE
ncbi:MarR family winged helix-turn-helix transcriptional regulator [Lacticaseibacillus mingshuiensis]|uniref:MarR family winged helix-turn-helix transcriptional regulator n=1 Tax=Lacticaseibacillus mingshuiensis TaxID=2799574 RepID=UPI00194E33C8|nr:helix-turn-helix domain-containing protein [Lacticaseibacillus mingshuiensis]